MDASVRKPAHDLAIGKKRPCTLQKVREREREIHHESGEHRTYLCASFYYRGSWRRVGVKWKIGMTPAFRRRTTASIAVGICAASCGRIGFDLLPQDSQQ